MITRTIGNIQIKLQYPLITGELALNSRACVPGRLAAISKFTVFRYGLRHFDDTILVGDFFIQR